MRKYRTRSTKDQAQTKSPDPKHPVAHRNTVVSPAWAHKPLRRKLAVNKPGDAYEQEADALAEQVMRTPAPSIQRCTCGGASGPDGECAQCRSKRLSVQRKASSGDMRAGDAPTSVHQTLSRSGQPLDHSTRKSMEQRFGTDFGDVRVHADSQAAQSARDVNARAYTVGNNVVFGPGQYAPGSNAGQKLIAHELVHTLQQDQGSAPEMVQRNGDTPSKVVVIGSPSPGEIRANHPFQFVHAAQSFGVDENTLWLVERTGYELAGISLSQIEQMASPGRVQWITPENDLIANLNQLSARSIRTFHVYSHGVPGNVTLRYGWPDETNYGLSIPQVRSMRDDLFAPGAQVRFDSCNTGTSDWYSPQGNVAQSFAEQSGRPVQAWTGRTSYTEINQAAGQRPAEVVASERQRGLNIDWGEVASSDILGRTPELQTFRPVGGQRVGGFASTFQISVRLPGQRTFSVPAQGAVVITCENVRVLWPEDSDPSAASGAPTEVYIKLHRERWGFDTGYDTRTFPINPGAHREVWSNLPEGDYYIEIWRHGNPGLEVAGNIVVDVHGND